MHIPTNYIDKLLGVWRDEIYLLLKKLSSIMKYIGKVVF